MTATLAVAVTVTVTVAAGAVTTATQVLAGATDAQAAPTASGATITVGSNCTLADAISSANTNKSVGGCTAGESGTDTIRVFGDQSLTASLPEITGPAVLDGHGATIDGGGTTRVLSISGSNAKVTVRNVVITGGKVSGNSACDLGGEGCSGGDAEGAGILVKGGATATLDRVQVVDNTVVGGAGSGYEAPAFFTTPAEPGGLGGDARGAGLDVEGDSSVTVRRSLFTGNATHGGTGGAGETGGQGAAGDDASCGFFSPTPGERGGQGNAGADGGQGGAAQGAIHVGSGASLALIQSTIADNTAVGGSGGSAGAGGRGGDGGDGTTCTELLVTVDVAGGSRGATGHPGAVGPGGTAVAALSADPDATVSLQSTTVVDNSQRVAGADIRSTVCGFEVCPVPATTVTTRSGAVAGGSGLTITSSTIARNSTHISLTSAEYTTLERVYTKQYPISDAGLVATGASPTVTASVVGADPFTYSDGAVAHASACEFTLHDGGQNALDPDTIEPCLDKQAGSDVAIDSTQLPDVTDASASYAPAGVDATTKWLPVVAPATDATFADLSTHCSGEDVRGADRIGIAPGEGNTCAAGSVEPITDAQVVPDAKPTTTGIPDISIGESQIVAGKSGKPTWQVLGDAALYSRFDDSDTGPQSLTYAFLGDPADHSDLIADAGVGSLSLGGGAFMEAKLKLNAYGSQKLTMTATDPDGEIVNATFTLTIYYDGVPKLKADHYQTDKNTELDVTAADGVLSNDLLPPSSDIVYVGTATHGTVSLDKSDGSFTYTPDNGYRGPDHFVYHVSYKNANGTNNYYYATAHITVGKAPIGRPDSYSTDENTTLHVNSSGNSVLHNDQPGDGDGMQVEVATKPSHGSLILSADGTFVYTPDTNYYGDDTFTYTIVSGLLDAGPVSVDITVNHVEQAPVAAGDIYGTTMGKTLTVTAADSVLTNDSDVDTSNADLKAKLKSGPEHGALSNTGVGDLDTGDIFDGTFSYVPDKGWVGSDTFTYCAWDGEQCSNTVTVTVLTAASVVNDKAPTVQDDTYEINENTQLATSYDDKNDVLYNDSDADPGTVLAAVLVDDSHVHGTLSFASDGSFTYDPDKNFAGTVTFTYYAWDGQLKSKTATVTITVDETEQRPVAVADNYSTAENTPLVVPVSGLLSNDTDANTGDTLTAKVVRLPAYGSITFTGAKNGEGYDGSFTYTPSRGFWGKVTFTYRAYDGVEYSAPALVTITVDPRPAAHDNAPVAKDDSYSVDEGTTLSVQPSQGPLANDHDIDGDQLQPRLHGSPQHGTVRIADETGFVYTPPPNFTGTDTFTYRAFDGTDYSNYATVTITVQADTVPVAAADSYKTAAGSTLSVPAPGVLGNDTDTEHDQITATLGTDVGHGSLTLDPDGSFTYTPDKNFAGTDSFTYTDSDGLKSSDPATVTIEVTRHDTAPVAKPDDYTVATANELTVGGSGVLANDTDVDKQQLTASLTTQPRHGTLTLSTDGTFSYDPANAFAGVDTFTYEAFDGQKYSSPATVTIHVQDTNTPPTATNDRFATVIGEPITVQAPGVLANDADVNRDPLTARATSQPANGTLNMGSDGSFTYTPNSAFSGTDSFTYVANDGTADSQPATVTITVSDGILIRSSNLNQSVDVGKPISPVQLTARYSDGDPSTGDKQAGGDDSASVTLAPQSPPAWMKVSTVHGVKTITGTPPGVGTYMVTIDATAPGATEATATLTINVHLARPGLSLPQQVYDGQKIDATATGFEPGDTVTLAVRPWSGTVESAASTNAAQQPPAAGDPTLGSVTADATGTASFSFTMPDMTPGPVQFTATGVTSTAKPTALRILSATSSSNPTAGSGGNPGVSGGGTDGTSGTDGSASAKPQGTGSPLSQGGGSDVQSSGGSSSLAETGVPTSSLLRDVAVLLLLGCGLAFGVRRRTHRH